ncbi:NEL-type E3 ubiquitin ligase domain-containing protein [Pseudomonas akapageensis]|uniref:NEL-type E3 ubiquitin ligase domain-containing protein n=1 Tax=Pseudomonas akapageensis TaxID=2609961 RepID=UPI00140E4D87|nr:NEL-type E3 ubiquitin ligase domain-containing protein [Pseudomonas akapageensis]
MSTQDIPIDSVVEHTRFQENLEIMARALPDWLVRADVATRQAYSRSLQASHKANKAAKAVLGTLQGVDAFASTCLAEALFSQFKVRLDVRDAQFKHVALVPTSGLGGGVFLNSFWEMTTQGSLLHAAMQNFTEPECNATEFLQGSGVYVNAEQLTAVAPHAFTSLCRRVDLGGRYQKHLHSVLAPDTGEDGVPGPKSRAVCATLAAARRCNLEVAAHVACMKGAISWSAYQMLLQVCDGQSQFIYDSMSTQIKQLNLFGHELASIVIFEQNRIVGPVQTAGCKRVVYIPGDPLGELREYDSPAAFDEALKSRVRFKGFRDFLVRHAPILEQARLEQQLSGDLSGHVRERPLQGELFNELVRLQTLRTAQDSRHLAVPTADVDSAERRKRLQALEDAGLLLLTLASFVVPLLNQMMLATAAAQLMSEAYEGIKDWTEDRTDEAMGHLTSIVESLGVAVALGAIGHRVNLWASQSEFFQTLRPVKLFGGAVKLWWPDLAPYRSSIELTDVAPSSDGRFRVGEDDYIAIDGHHYRVSQDVGSGQWRVLHPQRDDAFAPILQSNGQGAWRHSLEKPWEWPSARYLFRRLGPVSGNLDNVAVDALLAISGVDEAQLCRIHVDNAPTPARLDIAVKQWWLDQDIDRFIERLQVGEVSDEAMARYLAPSLGIEKPAADAGAAAFQPWTQAMARQASVDRVGLFEHFAALRGPASSAQTALIRRDFPGLPQEMAEELLEQSTAAEVARMAELQRVPLAMAEQARWRLREYRLMCALEGFYRPGRRSLSFEKLVLGLLESLPAWPEGREVQLHQGGIDGELIAQGGRGQASASLRLVRSAAGYESIDGEGRTSGHHTDLFEALAALGSDGGTEGSIPALNATDLHRQLTTLAVSDRQRSARLIGAGPRQPWFRMPTRLKDNRLGYPLSGRGAAGRHTAFYMDECKSLYPSMTNAEISDHLDQLIESGVNVRRLLTEKKAELQALQDTLDQWVGQGQSAPQRSRTMRRRRVADAFVASWRRQSNRLFSDHGELEGYRLNLEGADLSDPPVFPDHIDFGHVRHLSLRNTGMTHVPNGFLDAFNKLRILDIGENRLSRLPDAIADMTALEALHCENNTIVLSEAAVGALGRLRKLEHLDLNGNPLSRVPDVQPLHGLRILGLRRTGIERMPSGLAQLPRLEMADLRDNRLSLLPEEVYQSTSRSVRSLWLQDNPFSADSLEQIEDYRQRTGINLGGLAHQMENETRPDLFWSQGTDEALTQLREKHWFELRKEPGSSEFFRLLNDLTVTADYDSAREDLTRRVWNVVEAAYSNSKLRRKLFRLAGNPRTCGDSSALNFSYLEIRVEVFKAKSNGDVSQVTSRLLRLAKGLFRLEQLDRIVLEDLQARPVNPRQPIDEVEVSLAYRVGLAKDLDLPGQPKSMLYQSLAGVTQAKLRDARRAIENAQKNAGAMAEFVSRQDFWSMWLRKQHAREFLEVRASMEGREQALEARKSELDDQTFVQTYDRMNQDFQQKLAALQLRLTEEALRGETIAATEEQPGTSHGERTST